MLTVNRQGHPGILFKLSGDEELGAGHGGSKAAEEAEQVQGHGSAAGEQLEQP